MIIAICLFLILTESNTLAQNCPPAENLTPYCGCVPFDPALSMMFCHSILNPEEVVPAIKATRKYNIQRITFVGSSLNYIPSDIFKNTKFEEVCFEDTELMSLSNTDLAFQGLENHLKEIRAWGGNYVATWDWSQLRNLKRLRVIKVRNAVMSSLAYKFPRLELSILSILEAEISYIHPTAFSELTNLAALTLKDNEINEISRSMLPMPAIKLYFLELSNNKLSSLPPDMFTNMPRIERVLLQNNNFMTLKKEPFSGIFNKLMDLNLEGNEIQCDCRLAWLIDHKIPVSFKGSCHTPKPLHGISLRDLKDKDLYC